MLQTAKLTALFTTLGFTLVLGFTDGIRLLLLLTAVGMAIWYVNGFVLIRVPERKVYVIFNRERKAFARFLPHGRHFVLFPFEYVHHVITTGRNSAEGTATWLTNDGVEVSVDWKTLYAAKPLAADLALHPEVARLFPKYAKFALEDVISACVRYTIQSYNVAQLCRRGSLEAMQNEILQKVGTLLKPIGFDFVFINLTRLVLPKTVSHAMDEAEVLRQQTATLRDAPASVQSVLMLMRFIGTMQDSDNRFYGNPMDMFQQMATQAQRRDPPSARPSSFAA